MEKEIEIKHNLILALIGPDGKIKERREYHNIITTAGKNAAIKQILGDVNDGSQPSKFNFIGIGTGTTAETLPDTELQTEAGTRVQDISPDFPSAGRGDLSVTFVAGNATGAITEAGLLNSSAGGTMLARKTFAAINKASGDNLQVTWQITAG